MVKYILFGIILVLYFYNRYRDLMANRYFAREIEKLNKDNEFLFSELIKVNGSVIELIDGFDPKQENTEEVLEEIRQAIMN